MFSFRQRNDDFASQDASTAAAELATSNPAVPGGDVDTEIEAALQRIRQLAAEDDQTRPTSRVESDSRAIAEDLTGAIAAASTESAVNGVSLRQTSVPAAASSTPSSPSPDRPRRVAATPSGTIALSLRATGRREEPMVPIEPRTLEEIGVNDRTIEEIVSKFLLGIGEANGRTIADQLKLPFGLIEPTLLRMKSQQLIAYAGSTRMNDYIYVLSESGREKARGYRQSCTYFGSVPVPFENYVASIKMQSVEQQHPGREDLKRAFSDLLIPTRLLQRLGPAINSGRGMFLYGYPGNGKTSIAERVTRAFGDYIWIPRAVILEGAIMRVFDPQVHELAPPADNSGLLTDNDYDHRWVRIRRPTIVAGGELTMEMLEVAHSAETNIGDAPLQLKSNCGVLLIDDFGRQRISVTELLNRWIVPLEKRYDFLSISGTKKTQVPFDQLVIFSTNLEPKDLVDDAFLRRIPYKIEVPDPSEEAFRKLFEIMAKSLKIPFEPRSVDYLLEKHYKPFGRPMRNCHPRDLLLQIRSYCYYNALPMQMTPELFDFAVDNYFSIM